MTSTPKRKKTGKGSRQYCAHCLIEHADKLKRYAALEDRPLSNWINFHVIGPLVAGLPVEALPPLDEQEGISHD